MKRNVMLLLVLFVMSFGLVANVFADGVVVEGAIWEPFSIWQQEDPTILYPTYISDEADPAYYYFNTQYFDQNVVYLYHYFQPYWVPIGTATIQNGYYQFTNLDPYLLNGGDYEYYYISAPGLGQGNIYFNTEPNSIIGTLVPFNIDIYIHN